MAKKKPYIDLPIAQIADDERKSSIRRGDLWVADNDTLVLVTSNRYLTTVKGKSVFRRSFSSEISAKWMRRRINEFAEHVKTTKLPRGPRRQIDKDIAEIAKPIKRIRKKGKASKEMT